MARFFPFLKHYPGTNLHEIDLDYVLRVTDSVYEQTAALSEWADLHEEEYEDIAEKVEGLINKLIDVIVPWDSSIEYPIYSIVEYQGQNYIAVQPVPVGAMITNTDYWQPADTVIEQINAIGITVSELQRNMNYTTPEEHGAVGDGTTDDTAAFNLALADGRPVLCNKRKTYKANVHFSQAHSKLLYANLKGTVTFDKGLSFIDIVGCTIDASGEQYGIFSDSQISKLRIYNTYVHDAVLDNIHLENAWETLLVGIASTSAGNDDYYLDQFNSGFLVGTAYFAGNIGVAVSNTKACTIRAVAQECLHQGVDLNSVHGSQIDVYLEQCGYQGNDNFSQSQMVIGRTGRCIGNQINFYAIGGSGSDMESTYGVWLQLSDGNNISGFAERHLQNGIRCGANAKNNRYNVVDKTHTYIDYDIASCMPQMAQLIQVTANTLVDLPATRAYEYLPVVYGSTPYMVSVEKRTSSSIMVHAVDGSGNVPSGSASVRVYQFVSGIRTE